LGLFDYRLEFSCYCLLLKTKMVSSFFDFFLNLIKELPAIILPEF
jgi:hypothetical protein